MLKRFLKRYGQIQSFVQLEIKCTYQWNNVLCVFTGVSANLAALMSNKKKMLLTG